MKKSSLLLTGLLAFGVGLSSPAFAGNDRVLGAVIGGVAGGAIGNSMGGNDGAALGVVLGAAVGAAVADDGHRHSGYRSNSYRGDYYGRERVVYRYAPPPPRRVYYTQAPRHYHVHERPRYEHRDHHYDRHDRYDRNDRHDRDRGHDRRDDRRWR